MRGGDDKWREAEKVEEKVKIWPRSALIKELRLFWKRFWKFDKTKILRWWGRRVLIN